MRVGGQSGAGDFPSKVRNGQAGDVTERNLLCARDAGEFFYVDEEGQDGDGAVRYRMTDFAGGYQLPPAVLHSFPFHSVSSLVNSHLQSKPPVLRAPCPEFLYLP